MTLFGTDVSDFQYPFSVVSARDAGLSFITHKATEGTDVFHSHMSEVVTAAKGLRGIAMYGAYHVVRTGAVAQQVAYFLRYLDTLPWDWRSDPRMILQVDLEYWPYDNVAPSTGLDFARQLKAAVPQKFVVIYASQGQYGDRLKHQGFPLWNANYSSEAHADYRSLYPGDTYDGWHDPDYAFLQYAETATIGVNASCDADAFRGTVADLERLIGVVPASPTNGPWFYPSQND